jgi:ABC-type bacteriocin/lantibiotic exporter with double-glycine peptidase domain
MKQSSRLKIFTFRLCRLPAIVLLCRYFYIMSAAIIKCEHLAFSYENEKVFTDLSFMLNAGEKIALTGPSGRGKSTLLNILAGFLPDFQGRLELFGMTLNSENIREIRKKIAWLPQETALTFSSTREALTGVFVFKENAASKPDADAIAEILQKFELPENILQKDFSELSGGQRQRILLASAFLSQKPLIILDEPSSALDEVLKQKVTDTVLQHDATVLASIHDPYWINKSDRIINL